MVSKSFFFSFLKFFYLFDFVVNGVDFQIYIYIIKRKASQFLVKNTQTITRECILSKNTHNNSRGRQSWTLQLKCKIPSLIISPFWLTWFYFKHSFIWVSKNVKRSIIVQANPKVPFSVATTQRCRGECHSFPKTTTLTLDPHLIMMSN